MTLASITPQRLNEMIDAGRARGDKNIEKAALVAALFIGLSHSPARGSLIGELWKQSMLDLLADVVREFFPDKPDATRFLREEVQPLIKAISGDMKDTMAELTRGL